MKTVILKTWMRPTMPGKTGESRRKLHRSCVRRPLGGKARQRQAMCAHGKPLPCVCAVGDTFLAPAAFGRLSRIESAGAPCQAPARRQGTAETSDVRTRKTVALRVRRGAGVRGACRQFCRRPRAPFLGARLCRRRDRPCRMPVFAPDETAVTL